PDHGAPGDLDRLHTKGLQRDVDVTLDFVLQRARRSGELDREGQPIAIDLDAFDHVQGHDVAAEFGLLDGAERIEDRAFGECHERRGPSASLRLVSRVAPKSYPQSTSRAFGAHVSASRERAATSKMLSR